MTMKSVNVSISEHIRFRTLYILHLMFFVFFTLKLLSIHSLCSLFVLTLKSKVDVPVLVMYGERDKTPAKEESIYWMENIPDHTNVMIKNAEHVAFVGNPEDFHKEILRFLSSQCQLGEDTDIEDSDLDSVYDNEEYFGYGWNYGGDSEYDSEYDGDSEYGGEEDYEQFLYDYFQENDGDYGEYLDDTELYFDNKDLIEDDLDLEDYGFDDEGDTIDVGEEAGDDYRRRNTMRRNRRRNRRIRI